MADSAAMEKSAADLNEELDALMLADAGFFPQGTEIQNFGAAGSGFAALSHRTPSLELISREDEENLSQEERDKRLIHETRVATLDALIRDLIGDGKSLDPVDIGLTVLVMAWDLQIPPLDNMTQAQIGDLAGQGRAAICERHKRKIQRRKEAAGLKGTHNPRQKKVTIIESYRQGATGNRNRRMATAKEHVGSNFKRKPKPDNHHARPSAAQ